MYTIKLKRSNHSMTVKHVTRNVSLKHVGRRGVQGEQGVPGNPASNLVTSVNARVGDVVGLAEQADLDTIASDLDDQAAALLLKVSIDDLVVNVKDHGALGDDAAHDEVAINGVLSGGNVHAYIPEGTYRVYDYLRVEQNTTVEMHPNAIIKNYIQHEDTNDSVVFLNGIRNDATYSSGYNGDGNITITGGTIDSSPLTATSKNTQAIAFAHAEDVFILDVKFINNQYNHQIELNSTKHAIVRGCMFDTTIITAPGTREFINIDYSYAVGFPHFGGHDNTVCEDITIENNTFVNGDISVGSHVAPSTFEAHRAIKFTNNYVENMANDGIGARYWTHSDITGNTFKNAGNFAIHSIGMSDGSMSRNKIIDGCATYAISITSATGFPCEGNDVSENKLKNIGGRGIYTQNSDSTSIVGNLLRSTGKEAIYVHATGVNVRIADNNIIAASQDGDNLYSAIQVNGSNIETRNNKIGHGTSLVNYSYGIEFGSTAAVYNAFNDRIDAGTSGIINNLGEPGPIELRSGNNNRVVVSNSGTDKILISANAYSNDSSIAKVNGIMGSDSGVQYGVRILPNVTQTASAGYTAFSVNSTETSVGSGRKILAELQVAGVTKFMVNDAGSMGLLTSSPTHSLTIGSTNTGVVIYNTTDQTTNYERLFMGYVSNLYTIIPQVGGTGSNRDMVIGAGSSLRLNQADSSGFVQLSRSSSGSSGKILSISSSLTAASGMQVGANIAPSISQTGSAGYTMILVNPTEAGIGSGAQLLADFQVGGVSKFKVASSGLITASNRITNVTDPTSAQDATTKAYVDSAVATKQNSTDTWTVISGVGTSVTGTTTETTLATLTIPANALGPNGVIRLTINMSHTNNANAKTLRARFGGVSGTAFMSTSAASQIRTHTAVFIYNQNNTSSQIGGSNSGNTSGFGQSTSPQITATVNTTTSQTIVISGELANTGDTIDLKSYLLEYHYQA